jgi:hypothetical protein
MRMMNANKMGTRCLRVLSAFALGASLLFTATRTASAQVPPPAPTPPAVAGQYNVLTNDGSRFEGDLVERVVGDHVTIRLVTGEIRTIPAANIRAEWRAGQGLVGLPVGVLPQGLPGLLGAAGVGAPLEYHGPDELHVHIVNANTEAEGGTLYHESLSGWEVVCKMPCTTTVDPKTGYKLHNSNMFHFPSGPGQVDLVADIGSGRRLRTGGVWAIVLGASVIPIGAVVYAGVFSENGATTADKAGGGAIIGIATALVIGGIVMIAVGPSSTLTTTSGQRLAREPSLPLSSKVALTPHGLVF